MSKNKSVAKTSVQNPVAKFANLFNKCNRMKDKRQAVKRGETKHKNKRSEEVFLTFNFL